MPGETVHIQPPLPMTAPTYSLGKSHEQLALGLQTSTQVERDLYYSKQNLQRTRTPHEVLRAKCVEAADARRLEARNTRHGTRDSAISTNLCTSKP